MKKSALVIAGLALVSTNAFASKARLEALSANNGAAGLYVSDKGNLFRNAATINTHKNFVVTEWGTKGTATGDDDKVSPRAEGGFFKDAGSLAYGLYFGNDGEDNSRNDAGIPTSFLRQDNALDLFIGGDAGLQWGARLHYANSKDEPTGGIKRKNTAFGLGLGVVMGAAEGYANVDISDKSEGNSAAGGLAGDQYKAKPSFTVGGSYEWSGYTFFAEFSNAKADMTLGTAKATAKDTEIRVGAGRIWEINPTARVLADASIVSSTEKEEAGGTTDKTKNLLLPVTFGFEADATSWLTLRGSVGQNVILNNKKVEGTGAGKSTNANTTTVNAGATLNFGKLAVDGAIGTTKAGSLNTDELLSRVGVTYNF